MSNIEWSSLRIQVEADTLGQLRDGAAGVVEVPNRLGCLQFLRLEEGDTELRLAVVRQSSAVVPLLRLSQREGESTEQFEARIDLFLLRMMYLVAKEGVSPESVELVQSNRFLLVEGEKERLGAYVQVLCHAKSQ